MNKDLSETNVISYTAEVLRAQIPRMHPDAYEGRIENRDWLLQVGVGAGMLSAAADQIETLQSRIAELEAIKHLTDRCIAAIASITENWVKEEGL